MTAKFYFSENLKNMKKKLVIILPISLILLGLAAFTTKTYIEKDKLLLDIVYQSLTQFHYQKNKFNDNFSKGIYKDFIDALDHNKTIFLKSDIKVFKPFQLLIDDLTKADRLDFFDIVNSTYEKRFSQIETYFKEILANPFDFKKKESIETETDNIDYCKTTAEQKERWRKALKYQALTRIYNTLKNNKRTHAKNDTVKLLSFVQAEKQTRTRMLKEYKDWFHRLSKYDKQDRFGWYLNVIAGYFDPHTNYFPPKDKENFDISMSGQLEGIGATLTIKEGYVKVASLVPGGPAWKEGELKAGDLILSVAQGKQEPVNIVDMRLDNAVQLIRGKKGTMVHLGIKKQDGTLSSISIKRDIVIISETYARSAIFQLKKKKEKVGYLYLPKFYADFQKQNGRRCATDVKKELIKLNKAGVSSLIIDLRNNGGGSLTDVVKMFGYFITKGPVVQIRNNKGQINELKDTDPSVVFDKPVVVMVNEGSASASEIFAGAVQDYHRGIIIGSPSTFGKGTVQRFINFDQLVPSTYNELKPLGALKITIQKFYRVTGASTQLKGVASDIVLPDLYKYIPMGEKEQEHAMVWDQIKASQFTPWEKSNIAKIASSENKKIENDTLYNLLEQSALRMRRLKKETSFPMNYDAYSQLMATRNKEYKKFDVLKKTKSKLEIKALKEDLTTMENDSTQTKIWNSWIKNLQKDYYLDEAYRIASELK